MTGMNLDVVSEGLRTQLLSALVPASSSFPASSPPAGAPKKEVYFMAIIDILTPYDAKKKAAHAAKTVKHGVSSSRLRLGPGGRPSGPQGSCSKETFLPLGPAWVPCVLSLPSTPHPHAAAG